MTDSENKAPLKKKGGARPGAGRKPLIGAKTTTVILTEDLLIQLKRLGGSSWIRSQIAATTKPSPTKVADELFNFESLVASAIKCGIDSCKHRIIRWIEPEFMREPFFF